MSEHELVRRRRRIIKKKRKTLGRSNSDPKLLGHRSTADPVILFEGWGRWSNKERVLSPESLFNFDFGLFSDAKKRVGSRNGWSNGKRKRERKKRKKSRHSFYYREEERERERGNRHGRRVTNFCRVLTNRLYLARDEIRVLLRI